MFKEDKEAKSWRQKYFRCEKAIENEIDNRHFYMVALNLSGKREELEEKAEKLIDKVGYIKALKQTRT